MRISSRGQYGLRALAVLARRQGERPTQVREIARIEGLSAKYLEQLLGRLRSGGLVKSVRGARGGYQLARPAQDITVREVLVLLEGSLAPTDCVEADSACRANEECTAHAVWSGLYATILEFLDSQTLADLLARSAGQPAEAAAPAPVAVPEPTLETVGSGG
jgi:Rrf2 family cysteine metabolism transcriptional repressor